MKRSSQSTSKRIASVLTAVGFALAAALSHASGAQAVSLPLVTINAEAEANTISAEAESKMSIHSVVARSIGWGGCGTCGK